MRSLVTTGFVRQALSRSFAATTRASRLVAVPQRPMVSPSICIAAFNPRLTGFTVRRYSHGPDPLTREFVQERIVELLGCYDKIADPSKITPEANFTQDLGLDSLDVVEALFFIEEEFNVLIPDHEANEIHTVGQAIDYILAQPDAI